MPLFTIYIAVLFNVCVIVQYTSCKIKVSDVFDIYRWSGEIYAIVFLLKYYIIIKSGQVITQL